MTSLVLLWLGAAVFMALVMSGAWVAQQKTGQGGWADAFWSFGLGIAGVGIALFPVDGAPSARQWVVAALIGFWGARLGSHIAARAAKDKPDARYDKLKDDWGDQFRLKMFGFLLLQAGAASVLLLSILLAARNPAEGALWGLRVQDVIAAAVLIIAVMGEGIADRQLAAFKRNPDNKGKVCDLGLWAWSRHPNYFFEWLGWCAWPLFAINLEPLDLWPWGWLALTAPVYTYWLLNHVSGVPLLEEHMKRTRPQAFAEYARRVPPFFPRPPKG